MPLWLRPLYTSKIIIDDNLDLWFMIQLMSKIGHDSCHWNIWISNVELSNRRENYYYKWHRISEQGKNVLKWKCLLFPFTEQKTAKVVVHRTKYGAPHTRWFNGQDLTSHLYTNHLWCIIIFIHSPLSLTSISRPPSFSLPMPELSWIFPVIYEIS